MPIRPRLKLRPLTEIGLLAVFSVLLYANMMVAELTIWGTGGHSFGWPFLCRFESWTLTSPYLAEC